jgi:hypothetical protein
MRVSFRGDTSPAGATGPSGIARPRRRRTSVRWLGQRSRRPRGAWRTSPGGQRANRRHRVVNGGVRVASSSTARIGPRRPGGVSQAQNHSPVRLRVSQERGTDPSATPTLLLVCRFLVCSTAHADRLAACSQTTGCVHCDWSVSSPRRRIDRGLRASIAYRSFMASF